MSRVELDWAFATIPQLRGLTPDDFTISELPGYTNRNLRLHNGDHDWVLRLPRPATNRFIDRAAEAHNQELAHRLELAPKAIWRNTDGVTLTPTLRDSRSLERSDFDSDDMFSTIVSPLQRLHRSGQRFQGHQNLGELITRYHDLLDPRMREKFSPRMMQAQRTLSLLQDETMDWVPSHCDLVLGNLLLASRRLWLIDWEYSAMAPPYWDLALLCNEADFGLAQSRRLLQAYSVGGAPLQESVLFDYRGLLKLLSDCWMAALAD